MSQQEIITIAELLGQQEERLKAYIDESLTIFRIEIAQSFAVSEERLYNRIDLSIETLQILAEYVTSEPGVPNRLATCQSFNKSVKATLVDHSNRLAKLEAAHRQP